MNIKMCQIIYTINSIELQSRSDAKTHLLRLVNRMLQSVSYIIIRVKSISFIFRPKYKGTSTSHILCDTACIHATKTFFEYKKHAFLAYASYILTSIRTVCKCVLTNNMSFSSLAAAIPLKSYSVNLPTPRCCQSATFGRLTFCVYPLLFYGIRV